MTGRRNLTVAAVAALAALVALLAYGVLRNAPSENIDTAVADGSRPPAPDLRLPRLDGGAAASLADWRGKVVVLNFWASWCGPCREESPMLQRWHSRIQASGGTVLGVDVLDVTTDARSFIREYGLTYPMLRDHEGASARPFGVLGYPETLVIDRRGRIAAVLRGPVDEAFMRTEVRPLLREPA
jgi:cytochrome c biogenesis protein CcmG, thiol:disulfide interchange protein DsbE